MAPGDFTFDKKAFHDEKTGHYTMPEQDLRIGDNFLDQSGLYLPKPNGKMITNLVFDVPGSRMEVAETVDEVVAKLQGTEAYVEFTNPTYDGMTVKVNRKLAAQHLLIVETVYKDMELEKQNQEAIALQRRMQAQQIEQGRLASLNGVRRRK
jgi:hypothetical protein